MQRYKSFLENSIKKLGEYTQEELCLRYDVTSGISIGLSSMLFSWDIQYISGRESHGCGWRPIQRTYSAEKSIEKQEMGKIKRVHDE